MRQKAFVLHNKGMNRDLSISKATESSAYENHNIRVLARDHDTMLSVTNERGNKRVILSGAVAETLRATEDQELRITENELYRKTGEQGGVEETIDFAGILIGWNVLNNHVILFTTENTVDRIYRVDYVEEAGSDERVFRRELLFEGYLGFDWHFPIESVVYHETEDIQKIYWVDGKNVLRFMNFVQKPDAVTGLYPWQDSEGHYDNTYFDSNRAVDFGVQVSISKDNSGNSRPNGVVQYLLTYYNKHGQETNYVWISDLVYLSPDGHGGSEDGYNMNRVVLSISAGTLDTSFDHFRVYSVFRSALNGTTTAYLVGENETTEGETFVIDDGGHLVAQDSSMLLYLGSQPVHANTLTHKDNVLFMGNFSSVGRDYTSIESAIRSYMFDRSSLVNGKAWKSACVSFQYSDDEVPEILNIPYVENSSVYNYENQLLYTSSRITTFKGGEKYRFALKFQMSDGTETDAFWIGDAENSLYPVVEGEKIRRVVARCAIPFEVLESIQESDLDIRTVQLMVAEATYSDRSVKAQGIVNPTMFNVWERYNDRLYSMPSWISRPRNSEYAFSHFEPVHNSIGSDGEIECNFWKPDDAAPVPYYRYRNYGTASQEYMMEYYGLSEANYYKTIFMLVCTYNGTVALSVNVVTIKGFWDGAESVEIEDEDLAVLQRIISDNNYSNGDDIEYVRERDGRVFIFNVSPQFSKYGVNWRYPKYVDAIYNDMREYVETKTELPFNLGRDLFGTWCYDLKSNTPFLGLQIWFRCIENPNTVYTNGKDCYNSFPWIAVSEGSGSKQGDYIPSYYTKQYMFVDENVVTLNSPELSYEAVSFDNADLKFRIVGAARVTSGKSDYLVDASHGKLAGKNLMDYSFSWFGDKGNSCGLLSWPLWKDSDLAERRVDTSGSGGEDTVPDMPEDRTKRNSSHYMWGSSNVFYWIHMWNRSDNITGYTDDSDGRYGELNRKIFANLHYSYETKYGGFMDIEGVRIRHFNYLSSQYVQLNIGNQVESYNGNPSQSLLSPGSTKFPILWNYGIFDSNENAVANPNEAWLWSNSPIQISYHSDAHAVITLPTIKEGRFYSQRILPYLFDSERLDSFYSTLTADSGTDAIIPWLDNAAEDGYLKYRVLQDKISIPGIDEDDKYLFIGELYQEYSPENDFRYGGITDLAVRNCRFIAAGPQYVISSLGSDRIIYGNQGDTYFQRWDCLKTTPGTTDPKNGVIDITSVMLETHVNVDGRTDLQRGINELASIDTEKFGAVNPVYSQRNNFISRRDMDEDFNLDAYRSSITWSLEKHDSADVDEWSHVTLASTLKLDGDKGACQALRRMQNTIIAFQDRGISEILFNSRTQLSTTDGVPVEIANSGKVDGKRYITNKYGCTNKWSIVEGKNALYFVDNINKAFCAFNGQTIENLSTKLGFSAWFREINDTNSWRPVDFNNIVSYYDKIHSEVYLVRNTEDNMPCLVYNENLGAFTSFFDYSGVLMMSNVEDRFLSFKNHSLWLQNEGLYCNFFGRQYPYWMQYRVTPEPFSDKIWTNIDYRADFYEVLDGEGNSVVPEENLINGDTFGELTDRYKEWETFTDFRMWNEYQNTGFTPFTHEKFDRDDVRKKFRIWRLVVPRALREGTNVHGMDRIRNPWVNLMFRKNDPDPQDLMQLHDIVVKYFE